MNKKRGKSLRGEGIFGWVDHDGWSLTVGREIVGRSGSCGKDVEGMLAFVGTGGRLGWLEDLRMNSGECREDWRRRVIRGNSRKMEFAGAMEFGERSD